MQTCRRCKEEKPQSEFVGDRNKPVQTCHTCRFTKVELLPGEKHYQAYRRKKRAEDDAGFKEQNNKKLREWRVNNPDKVQELYRRRRSEIVQRWKGIKTYAKQKGIDLEANDEEDLKAMLTTPCFYCGHTPTEGTTLNGIDRIDSKGIYSKDNTVPCCGACNFIKGCSPVGFFIMSTRRIHEHSCDPEAAVEGPDGDSWFGGTLEARAREKEKKDDLTLEEKVDLWSEDCHLCGKPAALGIDRVNAEVGFQLDNCKPCCSTCNYRKKHQSLETFLSHSARIWRYTAYWVLDESADKLYSHLGQLSQPVAALKEGRVVLVAPSANKAADVMQVNAAAITTAVLNGSQSRGLSWRKASFAEYYDAVGGNPKEVLISAVNFRKTR